MPHLILLQNNPNCVKDFVKSLEDMQHFEITSQRQKDLEFCRGKMFMDEPSLTILACRM